MCLQKQQSKVINQDERELFETEKVIDENEKSS